MTAYPVGIDLGTTHSAVAWIDATGRTAMVPNADGNILTPSVVLFDDAGIVVGREALRAVPVAAGRIARWVKRDMGSPSYSQPIGGHYMPPEAIQACILSQLRADVERGIGQSYHAVITVPAFFDEPRRRATAEAAAMAGLPILDIVNEPTAAVLAFGEQLGYLKSADLAAKPLRLLVYDLGGGTFDVTVAELRPGHVRALATDGDSMLGGYDWDRRLVDYAAEDFQRKFGDDPRQEPTSLHQLLIAAEQAKLALSARGKASIRVIHGGRSHDAQISRLLFEERTADLLYRTSVTTRQVLTAASLTVKDVDRVLLVGGSTRMPMVRKMLADLFGKEPHGEVNPDEAVARGAALYASHLLSQQQPTSGTATPLAGSGNVQPASTAAATTTPPTAELVSRMPPGKAPAKPAATSPAPAAARAAAAISGTAPQLKVTNVSAHSLGIEGYNVKLDRRSNTILIPRNSPLPVRISRKFMTRKIGQKSIVVQVLEGESSQPEACSRVGRMVIRNLPAGLAAGTPVRVTYEYGANGRLSVKADVSGVDRSMRLEFERAGERTAEQIAAWRQVLANEGGFSRLEPVIRADQEAQRAKTGLTSDEIATILDAEVSN
jgi:molecular chaperone DnaK